MRLPRRGRESLDVQGVVGGEASFELPFTAATTAAAHDTCVLVTESFP
jgi:hypothetical protein